MICPRSSSATTDGTRFDPSSPGMMTGVSPSMNPTSEFVVPRSIPTMRSAGILQLSHRGNHKLPEYCSSIFQSFVHVANQVADVVAAVQNANHFVADVSFILFRSAVDCVI